MKRKVQIDGTAGPQTDLEKKKYGVKE